MSSPVATSSTSKRVTAVLPRASKTAISLFISQCAKNGTLDASTVLALNSLMNDRQFAIDYKSELNNVLAQQKEIRAQNKLVREEKKAAKEANTQSSDSEN